MQREKGHRCTGSHYGRPHGGDKREERALRASERREARVLRTPQQQLALLDARLGRGVGATRERRRLMGRQAAE